jgi:DDE superfamily endonuclease
MRKSKMSAVINTFLSALYELAYPYFNDATLFDDRIAHYASIVQAKSQNLVCDIWGFVDGTFRPCCRPSFGQKQLYSGHKRQHGIKFQTVVAPDGLIVFLYGPECGNRHDTVLWHDSGIGRQLAYLMPRHGDRPLFKLYGDPAYQESFQVSRPFPLPAPGSAQAAMNTEMSKLRQCVEWTFGNIVTFYGYLSWKREMKVLHKPVAKYYVVASFMWNIRSTVCGNETARFYGTTTMSTEEYLALVEHEE